jgi:hypothetical protein
MAALRTLQLYGTGSATGNAVAQVTIPSATTVVGAMVAARFVAKADGGNCALEFSKIPTSQIAVNGAQDPFLQIDHYSNFVTSGLDNAAISTFYPLRVSCRQGEIIYLHAFIAGTVTYYITVIFAF